MDKVDGSPGLGEVADRISQAATASLSYVSFVLVDTALRYRAVTGSMPMLYGYEPGSMIGEGLADVLSPPDFAKLAPLFRRALGGETFTNVMRRPGDAAILEVTYGPVRVDGATAGALAVVRDITAEHQVFAELAPDQRGGGTFDESAGEVLCTVTPDGRFGWVSSSVVRVLGWQPRELPGRPVFDLVHPKDHETILRSCADVVQGDDSCLVAFRVRRADATWRWVESRVSTLRDADTDAVTGVLVATRDVTERRELELHLARALEMFELSFSSAPIGMAVVGTDGEFLQVNEALCAVLGRTEAELVGSSFHRVTHPDDLDADIGLFQETALGVRDGYRLEKRYLRPDGGQIWALLAVSVVRDDDGAPRFFISQIEDLTERKNAQDELENLATVDTLTHLPNRIVLMEHLRHALGAAQDGAWQVGVVHLDIDHFRRLNDSLSHVAGDELLRRTADRLVRAARAGELVGRLDSDVFVVVSDRVESLDDVRRVADRLRAVCSGPHTVFGHDVEVTASVGVAVGAATSAEALLREAGRSLEAAKHNRPDRSAADPDAFDVVARDQLDLHGQLREGITRGELVVFYQAIVELASGAVTAREALVRWRHPVRGLLLPSAFLPGTDRSRLGMLIGEHVLLRACADAAAWTGDVAVHVNISARHLADPEFPEFVARCLATTGLDARRLVLEVTESLVLDPSPAVVAAIAALATRGVRLSLDDFGTGYSSLSALNTLPITSFKIDRSFVADADRNPTSAALVEGLIDLAARMHLDVVAEGIETRAQAEWLTRSGCPHGQGFYFGRPGENRW